MTTDLRNPIDPAEEFDPGRELTSDEVRKLELQREEERRRQRALALARRRGSRSRRRSRSSGTSTSTASAVAPSAASAQIASESSASDSQDRRDEDREREKRNEQADRARADEEASTDIEEASDSADDGTSVGVTLAETVGAGETDSYGEADGDGTEQGAYIVPEGYVLVNGVLVPMESTASSRATATATEESAVDAAAEGTGDGAQLESSAAPASTIAIESVEATDEATDATAVAATETETKTTEPTEARPPEDSKVPAGLDYAEGPDGGVKVEVHSYERYTHDRWGWKTGTQTFEAKVYLLDEERPLTLTDGEGREVKIVGFHAEDGFAYERDSEGNLKPYTIFDQGFRMRRITHWTEDGQPVFKRLKRKKRKKGMSGHWKNGKQLTTSESRADRKRVERNKAQREDAREEAARAAGLARQAARTVLDSLDGTRLSEGNVAAGNPLADNPNVTDPLAQESRSLVAEIDMALRRQEADLAMTTRETSAGIHSQDVLLEHEFDPNMATTREEVLIQTVEGHNFVAAERNKENAEAVGINTEGMSQGEVREALTKKAEDARAQNQQTARDAGIDTEGLSPEQVRTAIRQKNEENLTSLEKSLGIHSQDVLLEHEFDPNMATSRQDIVDSALAEHNRQAAISQREAAESTADLYRRYGADPEKVTPDQLQAIHQENVQAQQQRANESDSELYKRYGADPEKVTPDQLRAIHQGNVQARQQEINEATGGLYDRYGIDPEKVTPDQLRAIHQENVQARQQEINEATGGLYDRYGIDPEKVAPDQLRAIHQENVQARQQEINEATGGLYDRYGIDPEKVAPDQLRAIHQENVQARQQEINEATGGLYDRYGIDPEKVAPDQLWAIHHQETIDRTPLPSTSVGTSPLIVPDFAEPEIQRNEEGEITGVAGSGFQTEVIDWIDQRDELQREADAIAAEVAGEIPSIHSRDFNAFDERHVKYHNLTEEANRLNKNIETELSGEPSFLDRVRGVLSDAWDEVAPPPEKEEDQSAEQQPSTPSYPAREIQRNDKGQITGVAGSNFHTEVDDWIDQRDELQREAEDLARETGGSIPTTHLQLTTAMSNDPDNKEIYQKQYILMEEANRLNDLIESGAEPPPDSLSLGGRIMKGIDTAIDFAGQTVAGSEPLDADESYLGGRDLNATGDLHRVAMQNPTLLQFRLAGAAIDNMPSKYQAPVHATNALISTIFGQEKERLAKESFAIHMGQRADLYEGHNIDDGTWATIKSGYGHSLKNPLNAAQLTYEFGGVFVPGTQVSKLMKVAGAAKKGKGLAPSVVTTIKPSASDLKKYDEGLVSLQNAYDATTDPLSKSRLKSHMLTYGARPTAYDEYATLPTGQLTKTDLAKIDPDALDYYPNVDMPRNRVGVPLEAPEFGAAVIDGDAKDIGATAADVFGDFNIPTAGVKENTGAAFDRVIGISPDEPRTDFVGNVSEVVRDEYGQESYLGNPQYADYLEDQGVTYQGYVRKENNLISNTMQGAVDRFGKPVVRAAAGAALYGSAAFGGAYSEYDSNIEQPYAAVEHNLTESEVSALTTPDMSAQSQLDQGIVREKAEQGSYQAGEIYSEMYGLLNPHPSATEEGISQHDLDIIEEKADQGSYEAGMGYFALELDNRELSPGVYDAAYGESDAAQETIGGIFSQTSTDMEQDTAPNIFDEAYGESGTGVSYGPQAETEQDTGPNIFDESYGESGTGADISARSGSVMDEDSPDFYRSFMETTRETAAPEINDDFVESMVSPDQETDQAEDSDTESDNERQRVRTRAPVVPPVEQPVESPVEQPVSPEVTPEVPPEIPAEIPPEVTPEVTPEIPAEIPPEVTPEVTPEIPAEIPPEVTPEVTPEIPAEIPPEVTPEVTPEIPAEIPAEVPPEIPAEIPPEVTPEIPAEIPAEVPLEIPEFKKADPIEGIQIIPEIDITEDEGELDPARIEITNALRYEAPLERRAEEDSKVKILSPRLPDGDDLTRVQVDKEMPDGYPAEIEWQVGDIRHRLDIDSGKIRKRQVDTTDKAPHETLRVTKWDETPPPTRFIDLPGLIDAKVSGRGIALVQMDKEGNFQPARPQKRVPAHMLKRQGSRQSLKRSNGSNGLGKRGGTPVSNGQPKGKTIKRTRQKSKMARSILGG